VKSPEWWINWYFERHQDAGARAIDLVSSRGWVYEPVCGADLPGGKKCESETRHSTKEGFYACGQCGALWPFEEKFELKGSVQSSPRPGYFEESISRMVDVGVAYHKLTTRPAWKWKARLFVAHAMGWSYSELLDQGPVAWPEAPPDLWTPWKVRNSVLAARRVWQRLLSDAGIATR
jgi:hypothetical protein